MRSIAHDGVAQNTFVGFHFLGAGMTAGDHLHRFGIHTLALAQDRGADRNGHFRTDTEPQIIRRDGAQRQILADVTPAGPTYVNPRKVLLWESTRKEFRDALEGGLLRCLDLDEDAPLPATGS